MSALRLVTVLAVVGLVGAGARAEDKPDYAKQIVGKFTINGVAFSGGVY